MSKVTIYHLTKPMTEEQAAIFASDLNKNIALPPKMPLGDQSNGFFFFTTRQGADNHAKFQQETKSLTTSSLLNLYLVTAQIETKDVKYPTWQLDYEATRDYFFELFFNRAKIKPIKFQDVIVSTNNKTLQIQNGKKFMKLREFLPEHSGLIEKIVAALYLTDKSFKNEYNQLLQKVLLDNEDDAIFFAIKTTKCPNLLSCEKIANTIQPVQSSQIAKWFNRYHGKNS
jgi:hypothetical protein